ncbi:MerR family transcriptional regulator [Parasaccharibacter apium]|uniref:MerR family transcriptional regulator n=1 Tax=Parasaccharibacter apium TaxID=1510841 RepID=UPI0005B79B58|nr:MerR family transcriptional regulator [Parasaccharibacter apium]
MMSTDSSQPQHGGLRTAISVAGELGLPLYRLHSWESLYPVFRVKQGEDGQSYYDEQAVTVVRNIARLLYQDGARSHEVVPLLKREGIISDGTPLSVSGGAETTGHGETSSPDQLKELQKENRTLSDRLEEFGQIALSLKTLEDENASLKEALEQSRSAPQPQKDAKGGYVAELEEENLALQETVERLTAETATYQQAVADGKEQRLQLETLRSELAGLRAERDRASALHEELEAVRADIRRLETENGALRAAGQKQRETEATQGRVLEERNAELQKTVDRLMAEAREHQKEAESRKERLSQLEGLRVKLADMQVEHGRIQTLSRELEEARAEAERCRGLEAEIETLHRAAMEQQTAGQARQQELEKQAVSLRETVDRLKADARKQVLAEEARRNEVQALQGQLKTLQAEHEQVQTLQSEGAAQQKQLASRLEAAGQTGQELVRKLEQSVLIMQSLEDENVRLKRSLKESEEKLAAQAVIVGRVEHLEAENGELKQAQAGFAGERERHAEAVERIRTLEGEGVVLQQKLTAQDMENRLQVRRKDELDRLLHDLLGELAEMKKTLTL